VICLDCDRLSQPLFLGRLVRHFSEEESDTSITIEEAYIYAAGVVLCSALNVIVIHPYMMAILHMGMKIRVACCSLIYRKVIVGNPFSECREKITLLKLT
jgi:ATP-binding cassette subfamily C (CFTR/MRP) protein 4